MKAPSSPKARSIRSATTRASSKSISAGDSSMLNVDRIDLYYGAAQALRSVSLKAVTGRILCVLGRNGVGKSSLLRAIVGQHGIASGSIQWNGKEMSALPSHQRARLGFGYVPQGREIFPLLSVRENLQTGFATLRRDERVV